MPGYQVAAGPSQAEARAGDQMWVAGRRHAATLNIAGWKNADVSWQNHP